MRCFLTVVVTLEAAVFRLGLPAAPEAAAEPPGSPVPCPCFGLRSSFFSFRLNASSNFPADVGRDEIISLVDLTCFFWFLFGLTFRCSRLSRSALFWRSFSALGVEKRLEFDLFRPREPFAELPLTISNGFDGEFLLFSFSVTGSPLDNTTFC